MTTVQHKPFAITLKVGSSLANKTGSWRTFRPVYLDRMPPCNHQCPAGENIQAWLFHAEEGNYEQAWRQIMADNPFRAIMGRVCYHTCESACNRGQVDQAVGINAVERFLGDQALKYGWAIEPGKPTGKKVMVVGAGPARDWFEKRLPDACFVGHQEGTDLGRAVASMDILFNPSVTETFGNVTLEAMAAGLPVVAARATGSESLVTDGLTGRLVRPGACDQFCEALSHYCSDEESRYAAGRAGCEASKRYGWDEINHELIDAYIRIIRQHQSGGRQPRHSPVP